MAKLKHYIVTVEALATHEIKVNCTSEEKALALAKQAVKDGDSEPIEDLEIEVIDVYETELGSDD